MEPRGLNAIPYPYEVDGGYHHSPPVFGAGPSFLPSFFRNLKQDDIILIILIVLLLTEGSECDHLLVAILVVVFLAGFDGNFLG